MAQRRKAPPLARPLSRSHNRPRTSSRGKRGGEDIFELTERLAREIEEKGLPNEPKEPVELSRWGLPRARVYQFSNETDPVLLDLYAKRLRLDEDSEDDIAALENNLITQKRYDQEWEKRAPTYKRIVAAIDKRYEDLRSIRGQPQRPKPKVTTRRRRKPPR